MSRTAIARLFVVTLLVGSIGSVPGVSAEPSKEQCIEAHSRGQDKKEQGKITLARRLFMMCAQAACPALIQSDCARFANDLDQLQPTVSYAARDGATGSDLPDTMVHVDGGLVLTRLDDGKLHDLDPGKHEIRFVNGGRIKTLAVVIGSGEKGRTIIATFEPQAKSQPKPPRAVAAPVPEGKRSTTTTNPTGAKGLMVLGAATLVGGAVVAGIGLSKVPASCSVLSRECAAPPGDPLFAQASSGMQWMNFGFSVAGAGAVLLTSGVIWYFAGEQTTTRDNDRGLSTWVTPSSAGLTFSGRL